MPYSSVRKTIILWDIEECKIPDGLDACIVSRNITSAITRMGHHGIIRYTAYGDFFGVGSDFSNAGIGIRHTDPEAKDERRNQMLADILCHAIGNAHQVNLMLILGDISGHSGFVRALGYLKSKNCYPVLLAHPDVASEKLFCKASSVWIWSSLSAGEKPIYHMKEERGQLRNEDTDVGPYVRAKTAVFWDMEDCQIPEGLSADEVSQNIISALADMGYVDTVSTYAYYGDMNQTQGLESSGILPRFFPTQDNKDARLERILVDFLCCAIDNPDTKNLMLILGDISGHTEFVLALNLLRNNTYNCLLAQPENTGRQLVNDVEIKWLWSSLSAGDKKPMSTNGGCSQAFLDYLSTLA